MSAAPSLLKDEARRKRLGQYFTGKRLARLLVALSQPRRLCSAIDPMCGSGDMLAAVRQVAPKVELAGIEFDHHAMKACASRLGSEGAQFQLIRGNAFSWDTISHLSRFKFDLVITNPPYVRYQSLAGITGEDGVPSGEAVRQGLLEVARSMDDLDEGDRKIFLSLIKNYSGLSDLAVPSWILCSMLVGVGGNLAMVVPESWLNRNYAHPIHYLLLKLFRIRWVIEDAGRAWFDSASVKTTLMVATRKPRAANIKTACEGRSYLHVTVPAAAGDNRSVVGNIFPHESDPNVAFADALSRLNSGVSTEAVYGLQITRRSLESKFADLAGVSSRAKWFINCEPEYHEGQLALVHDSARLPQALLDLMPTKACTTLDALGVKVGQGLRTGANDFFYVDLIAGAGDLCIVAPGKTLRLPSVTLPEGALLPVLRKQSEVMGRYVLNSLSLSGRVLILKNYVHPDDLNRMGGEGVGSDRKVMPPGMAAYVTAAAQINVGTPAAPRFVPQLSAVRTNETKPGAKGLKARFWYMLPPLAKRHLPELFVPRVNYLHPRVMMNACNPVVIDANFSTIWVQGEGVVDTHALLAFLNSTWAIAVMELTAAVMGGGALKLEATHLRRLPVPQFTADQWVHLSALGRMLAKEGDVSGVLDDIDREVSLAVFGPEAGAAEVAVLRKIKDEKLEARARK